MLITIRVLLYLLFNLFLFYTMSKNVLAQLPVLRVAAARLLTAL